MPATGRCAPDGQEGAGPESSTLDREHLRRQCLDDGDLEGELLALFRVEAHALATELADDRLSLSARADIAHRLRGSALAVGAFAIARAAEAVEACGRDADCAGAVRVVEMSQAIANLGEAVARTAAEIDRLKP